jgi:cysteine synthase A
VALERAEKDGIITKDSLIVEPTPASTGLAPGGRRRERLLGLTLVMPESMSIERRRPHTSPTGPTLNSRPAKSGMKELHRKAQEITNNTPRGPMPMQFSNPANIYIHAETTAQEICADAPEGSLTFYITGGQLAATSRPSRRCLPHFLHADLSPSSPEAPPVPIWRRAGLHPIQGARRGLHPRNLHRSTFSIWHHSNIPG